MQWFLNLKVINKLALVFVCISISILALGINSLVITSKQSESLNYMYNSSLTSIQDLETISSNINDIRVNTMLLLYKRDRSEMDSQIKLIADLTAKDKVLQTGYEDSLAHRESTLVAEEKQNYEDLKVALGKYRDAREKLISIIVTGKYDDAVAYNKAELSPLKDDMMSKLQNGIKINEDTAVKLLAESNNSYSMFKLYSIIIISVVVLFTIAMGYVLYRCIVLPLNKLKASASRLSDYDFTTPIVVTRKDEFGQTATALNTAQADLKELIETIIAGASGLKKYANDLTKTTLMLNTRATEVNSSVSSISMGIQDSSASTEEMSASVQEINSSVSVLSSKALEGSNVSLVSKDNATKAQMGSSVSKETALAIYKQKQENTDNLVKESDVINTIEQMTNMISAIADQTNLLALNASIEAARAGENGRGFSVVADEVRKLAEQSASAVTEIKSSIKNVKDVFSRSIDNSNDLLGFIGVSLNETLDDYESTGNAYLQDSLVVSAMSEDIASMAEEITATIQQVSEVIQGMAETAQVTSDEAGAISDRMLDTVNAVKDVESIAQVQLTLANELTDIVSKFKL